MCSLRQYNLVRADYENAGTLFQAAVDTGMSSAHGFWRRMFFGGFIFLPKMMV